MKLRNLPRYLRFQAFDSSTEQGRADERYRRTALTIMANVASRGLAMLVMILSVKLTLPYLGAERFGIWTTIASFASMLNLLDLGVGNALINHTARAASSGDKKTLQQAICGGLGLMFLLGGAAALTLMLLAYTLPWEVIIKTSNSTLQQEIPVACAVFALLFGLNLFTTGLQKVYTGMQSAYVGHLANTVGSLGAAVCLFYAAQQQAGIAQLLLATFGVQTVASLALLPILRWQGYLPLTDIGRAIANEYRSLIQTSSLFFILQIGVMIGWGADHLIIANALGAAQVAIFSVTQRLFQFVTQPLGMINAPLWSAYADAHARGDGSFVRQTLKRSLQLTATIAILGGSLLVAFSTLIIHIWTNGQISVPLNLIILFAIWTGCESLGSAFAMLLNGCGIVKPQIFTSILLSVIALPVKIAFLHTSGIVGMQASYALMYVAIQLAMYGVVFRTSLQTLLAASSNTKPETA